MERQSSSSSKTFYFPSNPKINSLARSATATIPNIGFVVNASVIEESTTCKFSIPLTLVCKSTQAPILQLPLQWFTYPRVYSEGVVIYFRI